MEFRIMVVDDDKAVRRILSGIVENYHLGEVVAEAEDGDEAFGKILLLKPDIVLIDLLLPGKDGVEIVKEVKERGLNTYFIMISQVETKSMVGKAYESGIEFFIKKPINVIETVKVISKIEELIKMRNTLDKIKETMAIVDNKKIEQGKCPSTKKIDYILADIGILAETGAEDIKTLIENYDFIKRNNLGMQEIYQFLSDYYEKMGSKKSSDLKAIEMRMRRAISKALSTLAMQSIENYDNEQLLRYANILFEYKEVKKEMDFLRGKSKERGKVNVKKFLEGLLLILNE
ncbi:MAG: DNA-binding domain-containing protein [Thermovenabulum sp.]|uniref:DNA-binding domain-containing protein n=1 Tax=Thermovenabulum sp. TaxID=3100335 RepID=UPI003C7CE3F1